MYKGDERFSSQEWGFQTEDTLRAVKGLKNSTWERICKESRKYIGQYKRLDRYAPNYVNRTLAGRTGRATIIDETEDEDEPGSGDENMGEDEGDGENMGGDEGDDEAGYQ